MRSRINRAIDTTLEISRAMYPDHSDEAVLRRIIAEADGLVTDPLHPYSAADLRAEAERRLAGSMS
jgi:hypothetical protein